LEPVISSNFSIITLILLSGFFGIFIWRTYYLFASTSFAYVKVIGFT